MSISFILAFTVGVVIAAAIGIPIVNRKENPEKIWWIIGLFFTALLFGGILVLLVDILNIGI